MSPSPAPRVKTGGVDLLDTIPWRVSQGSKLLSPTLVPGSQTDGCADM